MQLKWNRPLIIPPGVIQTPFSLIPSNHINREHRTRLTRTPPSILCLSVNTIYTLMSWPLIGHRCHPDPLIGCRLMSPSVHHIHHLVSTLQQGVTVSRKSHVLLVSSRLTFDLMSQCFNLSSVIIGLMRERWITDGARHELPLGLACLLSRECE